VEAGCGRAKVPNRIKALDYVRAPVRPTIRSPSAKSAFRRQGTQIKQQILFQVEDRILPEPLAQSPRQPVPHPQRIPLEEFAKILRDNESVFPHEVAIDAYGEWLRPTRATVPHLGCSRCGQSWAPLKVYATETDSVSLSRN
jgi:hypothetical protein